MLSRGFLWTALVLLSRFPAALVAMPAVEWDAQTSAAIPAMSPPPDRSTNSADRNLTPPAAVYLVSHANAFEEQARPLVDACLQAADDHRAFVVGQAMRAQTSGDSYACDPLFFPGRVPLSVWTRHSLVRETAVSMDFLRSQPFSPFRYAADGSNEAARFPVWTSKLEGWFAPTLATGDDYWWNVTLFAMSNATQTLSLVGAAVNGKYVAPSCSRHWDPREGHQHVQCKLRLAPGTLRNHVVVFLASKMAPNASRWDLMGFLGVQSNVQMVPPSADYPVALPVELAPYVAVTQANHSTILEVHSLAKPFLGGESRGRKWKPIVFSPERDYLRLQVIQFPGNGTLLPRMNANTLLPLNATVTYNLYDNHRNRTRFQPGQRVDFFALQLVDTCTGQIPYPDLVVRVDVYWNNANQSGIPIPPPTIDDQLPPILHQLFSGPNMTLLIVGWCVMGVLLLALVGFLLVWAWRVGNWKPKQDHSQSNQTLHESILNPIYEYPPLSAPPTVPTTMTMSSRSHSSAQV